MMVSGGSDLVRLDPKGGRVALLGMMSKLDRLPRSATTPGPAASLTAALEQLQRIQIRRGQVIVISDFLENEDWARSMRRLALHHQIVAVQLIDPREFELPAIGLLGVVDPETGQTMHVQTNSAALRQRFAAAANDRHQAIGNRVRHSGAAHVVLSTQDDWLRQIARFVAIRRARGSGQAPIGQPHRRAQ
jgi:uncharacterized protein (DUF58 family)